MSVQRHWSHQTDLAAHASSASQARAFVSLHLLAHDLAVMVDDIQLVMSELATNAMMHAQTPFTVSLWAVDGTVRLEVLDGSDIAPALMVTNSLDPSGRGVAIVDAVSRDWGVVSQASGGKSVWAEFEIPGAHPPAR